MSFIKEVINRECDRERNQSKITHDRKLGIIRDLMPKNGNYQNGNTHEGKNDVASENKLKWVIVRTATCFSNNALDLLNKGPKFKITPRELTETKLKLRVATERLACAMRYETPLALTIKIKMTPKRKGLLYTMK